jgi:hypothetical protein
VTSNEAHQHKVPQVQKICGQWINQSPTSLYVDDQIMDILTKNLSLTSDQCIAQYLSKIASWMPMIIKKHQNPLLRRKTIEGGERLKYDVHNYVPVAICH